MVKYADITPFYEWIDWLAKESNSSYPEYNEMYFYEIRDKLDDLPELVRCKDCKHKPNCKHTRSLGINGYCSDGERRKDERKNL